MKLVGALEVEDLPEGWTPIEAVVLFKCLDTDGQVTWMRKRTPDMNRMEELGMITAWKTTLLDDIVTEANESDDD